MLATIKSGPIRFETTKIASQCVQLGKVSETHFFVCDTGCMSLIRICIYLYTCKGNITDGRGFEPQRFTGIRSLAPIDTDHHHQHQKLHLVVMLVEDDGGDQSE